MKLKVKLLSRVQLFATSWTIACQAPQSVHGIFQARVLEWVDISFSRGIFLTQGSNPGLPHFRQTLLPSEPPRKSKNINLFRCARSSLQHVGSTSLICGDTQMCSWVHLPSHTVISTSFRHTQHRAQSVSSYICRKRALLPKLWLTSFKVMTVKLPSTTSWESLTESQLHFDSIFIVALGLLLMLSTDKI